MFALRGAIADAVGGEHREAQLQTHRQSPRSGSRSRLCGDLDTEGGVEDRVDVGLGHVEHIGASDERQLVRRRLGLDQRALDRALPVREGVWRERYGSTRLAGWGQRTGLRTAQPPPSCCALPLGVATASAIPAPARPVPELLHLSKEQPAAQPEPHRRDRKTVASPATSLSEPLQSARGH